MEVARLSGVPFTTISSWGRSNQIPDWRRHKLFEIAALKELPLSTADFPATDDRVRLGKAA